VVVRRRFGRGTAEMRQIGVPVPFDVATVIDVTHRVASDRQRCEDFVGIGRSDASVGVTRREEMRQVLECGRSVLYSMAEASRRVVARRRRRWSLVRVA